MSPYFVPSPEDTSVSKSGQTANAGPSSLVPAHLSLDRSAGVVAWRLPKQRERQAAPGMFSSPLASAGCVLLPGLQVILYINEEEYNPFLVSSTGAKVIVHRQDEYPFIEDVGTEIETGTATSIGMHLVRE